MAGHHERQRSDRSLMMAAEDRQCRQHPAFVPPPYVPPRDRGMPLWLPVLFVLLCLGAFGLGKSLGIL